MAGINWKRLILGGLVAGIIVNISGIALGHYVLGREYIHRFFDKLGQQPTGWTMVGHLTVRMGFGFAAVFLCMAMRPRFGAGVRNSLIAAGMVFATCYVLLTKALHDFDVLVGWRLWVSLAWGAVEIACASCVAGTIYRDKPRGLSK